MKSIEYWEALYLDGAIKLRDLKREIDWARKVQSYLSATTRQHRQWRIKKNSPMRLVATNGMMICLTRREPKTISIETRQKAGSPIFSYRSLSENALSIYRELVEKEMRQRRMREKARIERKAKGDDNPFRLSQQ